MFDPLDDIVGAMEEYNSAPLLAVPVQVLEPKPTWLYDFCVDVCGHEDLAPQPHYEFINVIEKHISNCQFSGQDRRALLIEMPRGNFKTTITAEDLPVGVLTKNTNARIFITTHKDNASSKRLNAIKKHLEHNTQFTELFGDDWVPEFREGVWSSKAIEVARRTRKNLREPSVEVGAVGADTTGSHYDLIIADDLVNDKNVGTSEQRDKVHEYITSLFSLLDPGGLLIIIGTRWHPDDAYGRIISKDEERVKAGLEPLYTKYIRSCYDGPNGLYFPTQYGHEELDDLKDRMSAARFAANYLNKPVADSDLVFKPQYAVEREFTFLRNGRVGGLVRCDDAQIPVDVTMAWDTAGTKNSGRSDFHGLTVQGTDSYGRDWALVAEEFKGTPSEVVSRVAAHVMAYRPRVLIVEAIGSYELWKEKLTNVLDRYGITVTFVESQHRGIPKEERIAMLEPKWTNRQIILQSSQLAFRKQIDNFSMENRLAHDDILDSWQMHEEFSEEPDDIEYRGELDDIDQEWLKRKNKAAPDNIFSRLRQRRGFTR